MGTKVYYEGPVSFELNGEIYIAEVKAIANYWYQPCVMYFKDGSGQPEDWEYEIDELKILSLKDINGISYIETYNTNKDFKDDIDEAIGDELMEMSEWEFPEDYERNHQRTNMNITRLIDKDNEVYRKEMLEYLIRNSTGVANKEVVKQSQSYFKELIEPIYREVEWLCGNYFDIMSKIYPPAPPKDLIYDRLISIVFNEIRHNICK